MRKTKGEKQRERLLNIAYQKFIQNGYEKTSIDEIITEAKIAKGTYYYYFSSKKAMLEAVIDMMIEKEVEQANTILASDLSVPEKLIGVITSLRPEDEESNVANALNRKDNIFMHEKIRRRIVDEAVPLISQIIYEGINENIFDCDHVEERVRMILILSQHMFDDENYTPNDIKVFIDLVEKNFGARPGTLHFIDNLIR